MSNKRLFFISVGIKLFFAGLSVFLIGIHYIKNSNKNDVAMSLEAEQVIVYDAQGFTDLMLAAMKGNIDALRQLIARGAPLNSQSRDKNPKSDMVPYDNTALHIAIFGSNFDQNLEAAKLLIASGANVRIPNSNGDTPVHFVMQIQNLDKRTDIMIRLIRKGADVNVQNYAGQTIVHLAPLDQEILWVQELQDKFGSIVKFDIKDRAGQTPKDISNAVGLTALVDILNKINPIIIGQRADVTKRDIMGFTGFMLAIMRSDTESARYLFGHGADINATADDYFDDRDRNSSFHITLLQQNVGMVSFLASLGANVNIVNNYGDRPLHYVLKIDGIGKTSPEQAIELRNQAAQSLLEKGADINARNNNNNTVLHLAVYSNAKELVRFLIDHYGAKINLDIRNNNNKTALDLARDLGCSEIVTALNQLVEAQSFVKPIAEQIPLK